MPYQPKRHPLPWEVSPLAMTDDTVLARILDAHGRSIIDLQAIPLDAAERIVAVVNATMRVKPIETRKRKATH